MNNDRIQMTVYQLSDTHTLTAYCLPLWSTHAKTLEPLLEDLMRGKEVLRSGTLGFEYFRKNIADSVPFFVLASRYSSQTLKTKSEPAFLEFLGRVVDIKEEGDS